MSRTVHLKVKIKNFADESRVIRHEERKALENGRGCLKKSRDLDEKAFSETATPFAEYATAHYRTYKGLNDHRTGIVRSVARANLLAYGFLRGRSYAQIETKSLTCPPFNSALKNAKTFSLPWSDEEKTRWRDWMLAAREHIKLQAFIPMYCIEEGLEPLAKATSKP